LGGDGVEEAAPGRLRVEVVPFEQRVRLVFDHPFALVEAARDLDVGVFDRALEFGPQELE